MQFMVKYPFFCVLMWLALPVALLAQQHPKMGQQPDYSKEGVVIENDSTNVRFENDGSQIRESSARIRIQSDAGLQLYGLLNFRYQSSMESIDIDYVRTHKSDGSIVTTPAENIQDMAADITREAPFYSDVREKHVAVKGLGVGDVLEFKAHWQSTKPMVPGQFWLVYNFSHDKIILQEQLQVSVPRDRSVKWNSPDSRPVITEEGPRRIFTGPARIWRSNHPRKRMSNRKKTPTKRPAASFLRRRLRFLAFRAGRPLVFHPSARSGAAQPRDSC